MQPIETDQARYFGIFFRGMAVEHFHVTDVALFNKASELEEAESHNPAGYIKDAKENCSYINGRNLHVEEGWDLFNCSNKWAGFSKQDPAVVLVHGLRKNCADRSQRESQTCISHEDFKSAAAGALKAQFRSSIVGPPKKCMKVKSDNIDNWALHTQTPPELLAALVLGPQLHHVMKYVDANMELDLLGLTADALIQHQHVLQVAANRMQLSRRVVETVLAGWRPQVEWPLPAECQSEVRQFEELNGSLLLSYDSLLDSQTRFKKAVMRRETMRSQVETAIRHYFLDSYMGDCLQLPLSGQKELHLHFRAFVQLYLLQAKAYLSILPVPRVQHCPLVAVDWRVPQASLGALGPSSCTVLLPGANL